MKLTPYRPSLLRHPLGWMQWHGLGRPQPPRALAKETPSRPRGGPALFLRHLDCGSCNGCELALHALNTPAYDLPGHGMHFVASPRHANLLVMTGPLTYNMKEAALETMEQLPAPRIIAVGDCAGGDQSGSEDNAPFHGAYGVIPRNEWPAALQEAIVGTIPGCPPHPNDILKALIQWRHDSQPEQGAPSGEGL